MKSLFRAIAAIVSSLSQFIIIPNLLLFLQVEWSVWPVLNSSCRSMNRLMLFLLGLSLHQKICQHTFIHLAGERYCESKVCFA